MCSVAPIPRTAKTISISAEGYEPVNNMPVKFDNGKTSSITVQMQVIVNVTSKNASPEKVNAN